MRITPFRHHIEHIDKAGLHISGQSALSSGCSFWVTTVFLFLRELFSEQRFKGLCQRFQLCGFICRYCQSDVASRGIALRSVPP